MTHTYTVTGMTCNGCKASVEKALLSLTEVEKAEANIEKAEVVITMKSHISIEKLQQALPEKYKILQPNVFNTTITKTEEKSDWKQLFPLFLIFGYLIIAATLLNSKPWSFSGFMLDFMGLFYIVFSFFKLLDLKGFPESFKMYDPLAKVVPVYGWVYPFIEVALGLMFLMRFKITVALILTLIILGITTIGVTKTLLDKKAIQCACLGTALKLPMTKATFIENSIMIIMAIVMLFQLTQ
ncbi:heavy-metal-associated domain-containing protein [Neotamlana laminarinivorans]|uniref:Cation transporter n=1 Tax=Neotamlana laminarinivorans TaxID=2883124 RepID=A0A9X1I1X0_9FLAO|nr:heavy metal-associated domain-containing protein [Tamlana laminarinivorans]MCB4799915.1 cation transporter [Tamlana laminarinivorans]